MFASIADPWDRDIFYIAVPGVLPYSLAHKRDKYTMIR